LPEKPGITSLFRRSEIEKTTDSCSVCQEEINFFGMFHHMRARHPEEFPSWLLWATGVILALALPIAGMVLWMVFFGTSGAAPVIILLVAVMIVAQVAIDRTGKNWERKVNEKWKAAHPLSSKSKSKRGRRG
jgi:hypothetical protein